MSIAYGKSNAKGIIKTLFKSKGHRSNLLDKRFKQIGIAYCQDKKQRTILVFANSFQINKAGRQAAAYVQKARGMTLTIDQTGPTTTKFEQLSAAVIDNYKKNKTTWTVVGIGLSACVFVAVMLCSCCRKKRKEKSTPDSKNDAAKTKEVAGVNFGETPAPA